MYFTLSFALFALLHLSIEFFNGGVQVHYPLMRDDLPAISNWWGLMLLPLFAWFSYSHAQKGDTHQALFGLSRAAFYRLGGAFLFGLMLAGSFELSLGQTPLILLLCLFLAGAAFPIYRVEFALGFILGMTFTFGAVIPSVVAGIVALSSLFLHTIRRAATRMLGMTGSSERKS